MTVKATRTHSSGDDAGDGGLAPAAWDAFFSGDRRLCARLITRVENEPSVVPCVRDRIASRLGKAIRIGITGPPGVGKSTLGALIALGLAEAGHRIGIVAVDPSSPFTGGAFLGDRVRMDHLVGDPRFYVRSLASREGRGGLSPATPYVADVIEAFGMDRILVETVGVGQAELDVLSCVDIVALVLQPGTGDAIQTLKAGIIEGADVIVVNKADLPGAENVVQSLRFSLSLAGPGRPDTPILTTSAQASEGLAELVEELERQAANLVESGRHKALRAGRLAEEIRDAIRARLWARFELAAGIDVAIDEVAAELAESGGSPYTFVRDVCARVELSVRKRGRGDTHES